MPSQAYQEAQRVRRSMRRRRWVIRGVLLLLAAVPVVAIVNHLVPMGPR